VNDDGIALISCAHPTLKGWARFRNWLRCLRGIRRSSIETMEIEIHEP